MKQDEIRENITKCKEILQEEGLTYEERKIAKELLMCLVGALVFGAVFGLIVGDNTNL